MNKNLQFSLIVPLVITAAICSCNKESSSVISVTEETSVSAVTTITVQAAETSPTEESATTSQTTEAASEPQTTEPAAENEPSEEGYTDKMKIAEAYYQAYIDHDADAVYSMFNKDEIVGFYKVMAEGLEEDQSPEEVFRKSAVIRAIEGSMDNIHAVMDGYEVSSNDKWKIVLTEKEFNDVDKEKLNEFNEALGVSYSSAIECRYAFYENQSNGESFTGNSSAFMEKDGKWYLSFSNAMGTDLLNYLELE